MTRYRDRSRLFAVGIGTDTGGFSSLPAPRADATKRPLRYPFKSYDGKVTFSRERTGTRSFDLNRDGVAHYGLMPVVPARTDRTFAHGPRILCDHAHAFVAEQLEADVQLICGTGARVGPAWQWQHREVD